MKLENVPKDDAGALAGKTSFIQYAVNKSGDYVQEKSPGFEPQNIALEYAWDEVQENMNEALSLIEQGKRSPIYYFMNKEIMDIKTLSEYMNISKWRVKLHLKPKAFKKINQALLQKYATVFKLDNAEALTSFETSKWK